MSISKRIRSNGAGRERVNEVTEWDFFWSAIKEFMSGDSAYITVAIIAIAAMTALQVLTPYKAWTKVLGWVGEQMNAGVNAKLEVQSEALLGLGHDKIIYLTSQIEKRQKITLGEKTNLKRLYDPYRKLGGNGDCKTAYEYCVDLPVCTNEEADELDRKRKKHELTE